MKLLHVLLLGVFFFSQAPAVSATTTLSLNTALETTTVTASSGQKQGKVKKFFAKRLIKKLIKKATDSDGIVGALLALVVGGLGIHRVFLGSNGIIILWYILTVFGLFGIIPLIDFFRLLFGGSAHYRDNNDLFACFK